MSIGHDLYFWEPLVSPHKMGLMAALLKTGAVASVTCVAQEPLSADRANLGWTDLEENAAVRILIAPSRQEIRSVVEASVRNSIHVFSGLHWVPCVVWGLREVRRQRRRFGIMSEPRDGAGVKGLLRFAHSRLTEGAIRKHAGFVLAIGRHGPDWFMNAGYDPEKIFPFAYFVPDPCPRWRLPEERDEILVGFVGRMTREKGFDLFIDALHLLRKKVRIVTVGTGPSNSRLSELDGHPLVTVDHRGVVPMRAIGDIMRELDMLVVPSLSRNDGWAVVISEALMSGTPVVASSQAGGSLCLNDPLNGRIFSELKPRQLAAEIEALIETDLGSPTNRQLRRERALQALGCDAGAGYLLSVLRHRYDNAPAPAPFYPEVADR